MLRDGTILLEALETAGKLSMPLLTLEAGARIIESAATGSFGREGDASPEGRDDYLKVLDDIALEVLIDYFLIWKVLDDIALEVQERLKVFPLLIDEISF